jgi:hypothetical protein
MSPNGDLGDPISYMALDEGTRVFAADGTEVGHVARVLADDAEDVFDGIVIAHHLGHEAFADADQVAAIHQRGVTLSVSGAEAQSLPRPSHNPAVMEVDPADTASSGFGAGMRRLWDRLTGKY